MKNHQFLSFLKGAARACLTFAALSCVALSLTSCGGGAGDEETTDVARAARYFEGKTLELLNSPSPMCKIEMGERIIGTGEVMAFITYGSGSRHEGRVSILDARMSGEEVATAEIQVNTNDGSCTTERDFKLWWGEADNDGNLAIVGDAPIFIEFNFYNHQDASGTFYHFMEGEGEGADPVRLGGSATLRR